MKQSVKHAMHTSSPRDPEDYIDLCLRRQEKIERNRMLH
jgi:hypothetical protein